MSDARLRGLYAITPETDADLCGPVSAALRGGARIVQYRNKSQDARLRVDQARQLAALCAAAGALLIVNDDVPLAREVGAGGVHLGKDDAGIADARAALGTGAVIGASCYDSLERARTAAAAGADYVAFGSFHPSPTKPDAVRAEPGLLQAARGEVPVALCAIGGITPANALPLLEAGADMLAVISGVFGAADVEAATRRYAALWTALNG